MVDITISIVLFQTDKEELRHLLSLINESPLSKHIYLIDNSTNDDLRIFSNTPNVEYIFNYVNVGYGAGHNVAIGKAQNMSKYHIIMNSDIDFNPIILEQAFICMETNDNIGMISPKILLPDGELQHFCRKLPTPFDLFARRFVPGFAKPLFKRFLDNYLLLNKDYSSTMNIPNLPGCFMFVRTAILVEVGGFDENFFLYVEDIDLTRRLHEKSVTLYYPNIVVRHSLARGSYKDIKLVLHHIASAIYYFNKWGWFNDKGRITINKNLTH
jgi:GT2 family glycosyltransferase